MRRSFACSLLAAMVVVACGGREPLARAPLHLTSGRYLVEPSTPALVERLAFAVCLHEATCERPQTEECLEYAANKARAELASWMCEPSAARARVEECLASIPTETCELDLTMKTNVCPVNAACGNVGAELVSPGRALGRRRE